MRKVIALAAAVLAILIGTGVYRAVSADLYNRQADAVRQAVLNAAVQCNAIEGMYPGDVRYLEENYGLRLDHDRYIVDYELYAENILPEIEIIRK